MSVLASDIDSLPRSWKDARLMSAQLYFTGKPCKREHIAPRYTSNRICQVCQKEKSRNQYLSNKEVWAKRNRKWVKQNPSRSREIIKLAARRRREAKPEEEREYARKWRKENSNKVKGYTKKLVTQNRERYRDDPKFNLESRVRRRVRALLRGKYDGGISNLVGWSSKGALWYLREKCPKAFDKRGLVKSGYHLDHIQPLNTFFWESPEDEGFQKAWALENLRLIPAQENLCRPKDGRDLLVREEYAI